MEHCFCCRILIFLWAKCMTELHRYGLCATIAYKAVIARYRRQWKAEADFPKLPDEIPVFPSAYDGTGSIVSSDALFKNRLHRFDFLLFTWYTRSEYKILHKNWGIQ